MKEWKAGREGTEKERATRERKTSKIVTDRGKIADEDKGKEDGKDTKEEQGNVGWKRLYRA